jgi:hypothetical protein
MNYSFPATKWVKTAKLSEQFDHVMSEVEEMCNATYEVKDGNHRRLIEEAVDLYHSLETLFRIYEREGIHMNKAFEMVQLKNEARGYYVNHQPRAIESQLGIKGAEIPED